jgi:hypothetical protein
MRAPVLWFVNVAILGYAALRLASWLGGEPDPRMILASAHIAYYWRVATASWWGALAAAAGARFGGADLAGKLLPAVVAAATLVAVLVP